MVGQGLSGESLAWTRMRGLSPSEALALVGVLTATF